MESPARAMQERREHLSLAVWAHLVKANLVTASLVRVRLMRVMLEPGEHLSLVARARREPIVEDPAHPMMVLREKKEQQGRPSLVVLEHPVRAVLGQEAHLSWVHPSWAQEVLPS